MTLGSKNGYRVKTIEVAEQIPDKTLAFHEAEIQQRSLLRDQIRLMTSAVFYTHTVIF